MVRARPRVFFGENQRINLVLQNFGAAPCRGSYYRQSARHGFKQSDTEGFFPSRREKKDLVLQVSPRQSFPGNPPGKTDIGIHAVCTHQRLQIGQVIRPCRPTHEGQFHRRAPVFLNENLHCLDDGVNPLMWHQLTNVK